VNLVLAWFALVDNSYSLRLAITSALQTYLFCMNAWLVYRHGMHTFPRIMLTCVLASAAILQIIRYGASLTNPQMVSILDTTTIQVAYVTTYPFIMLLFSISTILLASERLRDELERMSNHDPLTGLLNRRAFEEQTQREWARRIRQPQSLSALAFDLDHFKSVNDTYGHAVGDIVLAHAARVLRDMARETDIVARLGGEEFVTVMPGASEEQALAVAERIRSFLANEPIMTPGGQSLRITTSVGLASANSGDVDIHTVLQRADKALYEAKKTGRNRICRAPD
jgi:diguanylate cyclase (GGDEF)-like protein